MNLTKEIPLASSVPVVLMKDATKSSLQREGQAGACHKGKSGVIVFVRNGRATVNVDGDEAVMPVGDLRVKLDDPQGALYALSELQSHTQCIQPTERYTYVINRILCRLATPGDLRYLDSLTKALLA